MDNLDKRLVELGISEGRCRPYSSKDVAEVENRIGAKLPQPYRHFLETFGHSSLEVAVKVKAPVVDTPPTLDFGIFLSPKDSEMYFRAKDDVLPEGIMPFGEDGGGNLFCIGVNDREYGRIFYHNHNFGWESEAEEYESRGEPSSGHQIRNCREDCRFIR